MEGDEDEEEEEEDDDDDDDDGNGDGDDDGEEEEGDRLGNVLHKLFACLRTNSARSPSPNLTSLVNENNLSAERVDRWGSGQSNSIKWDRTGRKYTIFFSIWWYSIRIG